MERWRVADLHAYVDDCLEPRERRALEALLAENPALGMRVAEWRAQNSAIRAAFHGEAGRAYLRDCRPRPEGNSLDCREADALGEQTARKRIAGRRRGADWLRLPRMLSPLVLAGCLVCVSGLGSAPPSNGLGEAGVAAFRAFTLPGGPPMEFSTGDAKALERWLDARLARRVILPPTPPDISLAGARIAPAPRSAAAFLLYETDGRRLGLLVQSLDAPPQTAPGIVEASGAEAAIWTAAGEGFVLVGDRDPSALRQAATRLFDALSELAQPTPERGS